MTDHKRCSKCHEDKILTDFYFTKGRFRADCKTCVNIVNRAYSKRHKPWLNRFVDEAKTIPYSKQYYKDHKKKFDEYAHEFHKKNPGYRRDYYLKMKAKKHEKPCQVSPPGT